MTLTKAAFGLFVVVWLSLFSHYWTLHYLVIFTMLISSSVCSPAISEQYFNHSSFYPPSYLSMSLFPAHISFIPPLLWHYLDPPRHRFLLFLSFIALLNITCFPSFYYMTSTGSTNQRCTSSQCPRERPWGRRSAAWLPRMPTWERTRTWPIWSKMVESSSKSPLTLRRRKLLSLSRRYN